MKKKQHQRIKEVSKVLFSVLMSCILSVSAFADAVSVNNWVGLKGAVAGDANPINVLDNITRGASDEDITISRELSIVGTETGKFLSGADTYAGLTVDSGGNLTLTDINMQNFKSSSSGGAISNTDGTISSITGDFKNNFASSNGGAIYNFKQNDVAIIEDIKGNFSKNSANAGGAIYNINGTINKIAGDFESNSATTNGGAISNFGGSSKIGNIAGDFKGNHTDTNAGAIYNGGTIGNSDGTGGITGDFENNSATNMGGAIVNTNTINKVTGNFTKNSAKNGGAVYNAKTINFVAENNKNIIFSGNYVTDESGNGGAIFNATTGTVGLYASADHSITFTGDTTGLPSTARNVDSIHNINILNINGDGTIIPYTGTVNLYSVSDAATAKGTTNIYGGTVNVAKDITQNNINVKSGATLASNTAGVEIKADGTNGNLINDGTINITGANSRFGADHLTNNATINITGTNSLLETSTLTNNGTMDIVSLLSNSLNNNGSITTSGAIEALIQNNEGGSITFNGDAKKQMELTNSGTVNFNGGLSETGSIIRLTQNDGVMNFSTVAINSTINHSIDNFTMNGGTVNIADGNVNTLHINKLNLTGNTNFAIDADLAAKNMDKISVSNVFDNSGTINISDIKLLSDATEEKLSLDLFADDTTKDALKDKVTGNLSGIKYSPIYKYDALYDSETGIVDFTRKNGGDDFNPAILAGAVASQVGGYLNQLSSYENAFEHIDTYMLMSKKQKTAKSMLNNMYASTDNAVYSQPLAEESKGIWVKPYAVFEKVSLQGGPRVDNKMYGAFAGIDFDLIELRNDWNLMYSAYASYDGSHQDYDGVNIYQNGGHLGAAATWYKENFFVGLTANVGASAAEASTMYGTDNMTTLMTGAAAKTGYNIELEKPNLVIQPSLMMSYSFVNTFDYTNAAGVKIKSDPLHSIQIAPGVKFIGNLPHEWHPYIAAQMVWNMIDETKFTANNINLPGLSTKRYFQYGVGAQKSWGNSFSGYLQAMMRNEGRTGVAFNAGIRWAFGNN